ncbi:hypothetical protein KEM48_002601 [Puccinia striiformis f. sp. tritici PST-130]|nr:hypothetical protein KEM48_002601 [Puccinia striiformis f. sp. tritici PST-130]
MAAFPSQQDYLSDQSDEIFNSFSFPVGDPSSEFFNVASSAEGVQPPLSFNFSPSPLLSASSTPTTCTEGTAQYDSAFFDYALRAIGALPPGQSTASISTPSVPAYPAEQTTQAYQWQSFNASGRSTAELPFQLYPTTSQQESTPLSALDPELLHPSIPGAPLPVIAPHLPPDPHAANSQAGSSTGSKRSAFDQSEPDGGPAKKKAKKEEYRCYKIPGCKFVGTSTYNLNKHQEKKSHRLPDDPPPQNRVGHGGTAPKQRATKRKASPTSGTAVRGTRLQKELQGHQELRRTPPRSARDREGNRSCEKGNGAESIGDIKISGPVAGPSRQSALEIPVLPRDFNIDAESDSYGHPLQ